jgi:acyl-coenzyme A thioesterase PaaI-like protein
MNTAPLQKPRWSALVKKGIGALKSRPRRLIFDLVPCYRRTGVKVIYISQNFREVRIKLPLNWKTRGYNDTTFGGSMYACIDPIYTTMIEWNLGKDYVALDKSASIEFRKPGKEALFSTFKLADGDIDAIRAELEDNEKADRVYDVDLTDSDGVVYASCRKTVQIRKKRPK